MGIVSESSAQALRGLLQSHLLDDTAVYSRLKTKHPALESWAAKATTLRTALAQLGPQRQSRTHSALWAGVHGVAAFGVAAGPMPVVLVTTVTAIAGQWTAETKSLSARVRDCASHVGRFFPSAFALVGLMGATSTYGQPMWVSGLASAAFSLWSFGMLRYSAGSVAKLSATLCADLESPSDMLVALVQNNQGTLQRDFVAITERCDRFVNELNQREAQLKTRLLATPGGDAALRRGAESNLIDINSLVEVGLQHDATTQRLQQDLGQVVDAQQKLLEVRAALPTLENVLSLQMMLGEATLEELPLLCA